MAIDIKWYIEDHVLLARVYGKTSSEDLIKGDTIISHLMEETESDKLHLIFDITDLKEIDITVSQSLYRLSYLRHPKMGSFLVYGTPKHARGMSMMIGTVVNNMTYNDFKVMNTLKSCVRYLKKMDKSILRQQVASSGK